MNISENDLELLIQDIYDNYGYDFSNYARASLKRRFTRLMVMDRFPSFAELRYRILNDAGYVHRLVEEITVNVTEMFRDAHFFSALRTHVLPILGTYPFIKVWHSGASTGEEVYSMAILLHEAGLLKRSLIYATDLNASALEVAQRGIYPLSALKMYSENYIASGGVRDFSRYYSANYNNAKFVDYLSANMVFSTHNLVADGSFNEFQLVICRNVLIYFDKHLQNRVFHLFNQSIEPFGFLALGAKETINHSDIAEQYMQIKTGEKIWRKIAR